MKRISVIVFSLAITLSAFAYYGDYGYSSSSSEMSGWLTFLFLVMFVWGILEIILFFKIWGMTNDIKALKKDHFCETQFEGKNQMARFLRKNLVLGNKDAVKRILLQNFIDNLEHDYGELRTGDYEKDESGTEKWVSYKERNLNIPIIVQSP